MVKIVSEDSLEDTFTDTLPNRAFNRHLLRIGLRDMSHLLL